MDRINGTKSKIDGLGLQSHDKRTIASSTWQRLENLAGSHKSNRLWITELDIEEIDPIERAKNLEDFLITVFSHPNTDAVILWTWLREKVTIFRTFFDINILNFRHVIGTMAHLIELFLSQIYMVLISRSKNRKIATHLKPFVTIL